MNSNHRKSGLGWYETARQIARRVQCERDRAENPPRRPQTAADLPPHRWYRTEKRPLAA